jgi:hypothetical protein
MSGYTVENMSFGPVDSSDLERLLGTTADTSNISSFMGNGGDKGGYSGPGST